MLALAAAVGFLALFIGYGLNRGYDVVAGLTHLFEGGSEPVVDNPALTNVAWQEVTWLADIDNRELDEASGLAASARHPGMLYTVNDSGSDPIVYGLDLGGAHVGAWPVNTAEAVDWEAMDAFVHDGVPYLVIADTGDNLRWRDEVSLLIVPEPESLTDETPLDVAWKVRLTLPERAYDIEAMAVDAASGWAYLLSKRNHPQLLFRVPLMAEGLVEAETVAAIDMLPRPDELDFEVLEDDAHYRHMPTGMDLDPESGNLVVVTLKHAYVFNLARLDAPPERILLPTAGQREAITFVDQNVLVFTRERSAGTGEADLFRVEFRTAREGGSPLLSP